jgi:hypothetical protein
MNATYCTGPVHVLSAAHNLELLRHIRAYAAAQARLLIVDLWMDSSHTQPPTAPLMSGEFLVISGEGQAYGEDAADQWLRRPARASPNDGHRPGRPA